MVFSSIPFLYYFLPCALILYFVTPKKFKNTALLITSLVFYGWGEPKYLLLMVASIIVGYVAGLLIEAFSEKKPSKVVFIISTVILVGFLAVFKYADFFVENFNEVTGLSVGLLNVALPIGISFYTFQILSYTIDVYRGSVPAQKNFIDLASYIALFPQLIAGPIVRYSDIANQLKNRTHSFERFATGFRRFVVGLSKKVFIANVLGELCATFKGSDDKSVLFYWLYAVAFALQVYFDFSGYSDMAIGLGRIMGFDFIENFDYPYISKSATEFWRRWHISLGTWFRDYIYIPLGGNRVSMPCHFFNIFVVWLLTGMWHGAAWTFVVWGLYFAVLLVIEKVFLLKYLEKSKVLSRIYTLLMVLISFVIFNATDMGEGFEYIKGMLGLGGVPVISGEFTYCLKNYGMVLVLAIIGATPIVKRLSVRLCETKIISGILTVVEPVLIVVALTAVTAFLVDGSFNPFLYFRF